MYKLVKDFKTGEINAVNKTEGNLTLSIPFIEDNMDYRAYLKWVEEGNTAQPADELVP
jgi:hypothetical protein